MYKLIFENQLNHHGVLGMHWGVRRYQNEDGSLTPAGKKRLMKKVYTTYKKEGRSSGETVKEVSKEFADHVINDPRYKKAKDEYDKAIKSFKKDIKKNEQDDERIEKEAEKIAADKLHKDLSKIEDIYVSQKEIDKKFNEYKFEAENMIRTRDNVSYSEAAMNRVMNNFDAKKREIVKEFAGKYADIPASKLIGNGKAYSNEKFDSVLLNAVSSAELDKALERHKRSR